MDLFFFLNTSHAPFVLLFKSKICDIVGPNEGAGKGVSWEIVQLLLSEQMIFGLIKFLVLEHQWGD